MIHWFGWPSSWDHPDFAEWDDNCADTLDAVEEIRRTGAIGLDASAWRRDLLDLSSDRPWPDDDILKGRFHRKVYRDEDESARERAAERDRLWRAENDRKREEQIAAYLTWRDRAHIPRLWCDQKGWRPGRTYGGWHQGQIRWNWGDHYAMFDFAPPCHDYWASPIKSWRRDYCAPSSGTIPSRLARHFLMYSRA